MENDGGRATSSPDFNPFSHLPFGIYCSLAQLAGVPIKFCGADGHLLSGIPMVPPVGPCAILGAGTTPSEDCAKSHVDAAATAARLGTPYIFNCHMRLVAWAIPILNKGQPLAPTIVCGGVLLSMPDAALTKYTREVAPRHGVDPAVLTESLDAVPVLSRSHLRATAEFLFQLTNTFIAHALQQDIGERHTTQPVASEPRQSLIFPPMKTQETKKARAARARKLAQESHEVETVRLLRQREPERALEVLAALVMCGNEASANAAFPTHLRTVETFSRLFRAFTERADVPLKTSQAFSRLAAKVLSERTSEKSTNDLRQVCQEFVSLAEDLADAPRPRKLRTIENYIRKNLPKQLTLGAVSERFGITERVLNVLVQKSYGMSFAEYVGVLRLAEAKRLLQETGLTVGEIAARTGFKDQSYFTKVVKSRLGLTPSDLRGNRP